MPVVNYLSSRFQITNLKVGGDLGIEEGKPIPLHIAVRKDIGILADILQKGMTAITDDELRTLHKKWLVSATGDPPTSRAAETSGVVLSSEEKSFLEGRKIRLGIDIARPPFEYIDGKARYSGISADFITAAAERLNIGVVPLRDMKSEKEKTEIKNHWLSLKYETRIPWHIIGPIGAALLIIITFVLIWNRRLGRVIQEREGLYRDLRSAEQTLNIALEITNYFLSPIEIDTSKFKLFSIA